MADPEDEWEDFDPDAEAEKERLADELARQRLERLSQQHDPMAIFDAIFGRSRGDSVIGLGSRRPLKDGGDPAPHYLCAVSVQDRRLMLPGIFRHQVDVTQYLLQNTLSPSALRGPADAYYRAVRDESALGTYKTYFEAKNKHVRELCALVVDLDVGRPGDISAGMALGAALDLAIAHKIPVPSLGALSGRGAYLWWLLRTDSKEPAPPLADHDNVTAYTLCVNALLRRLEFLKADSKAKRLANWYKRPGTIDTKTGNMVVYMTFGVNSLSNVPLYTLPTLMKYMDVELPVRERPALPPPEAVELVQVEPPTIQPKERTKARIRNVKPGKGGEPMRRRADEIKLLVEYRGGIAEGCRHFAAWYYFQAERSYLQKLYRDDPDRFKRAHREAVALVVALNKRFRPALSASELQAACKTDVAGKGWKAIARNRTVAESLNVTQTEVDGLGLRSLLPTGIAAERKKAAQAESLRKRTAKRELAEAVDRELVEHPDMSLQAIADKYGLGALKGRQYVRARRERLKRLGKLDAGGELLKDTPDP
jgi:hypothetical protein